MIYYAVAMPSRCPQCRSLVDPGTRQYPCHTCGALFSEKEIHKGLAIVDEKGDRLFCASHFSKPCGVCGTLFSEQDIRDKLAVEDEDKTVYCPHHLPRLPKIVKCPDCAGNVSRNAEVCPHCGNPLEKHHESRREANTQIRQFVGAAGSILLFIGVFAPILHVPVWGNVDYFQNGEGDGIILLALAGLSLILVLTKQLSSLWFTGIASIGVLLFTFINVRAKLNDAKIVTFQWGWALLVVGAILLIVAAAMTSPSRENT